MHRNPFLVFLLLALSTSTSPAQSPSERHVWAAGIRDLFEENSPGGYLAEVPYRRPELVTWMESRSIGNPLRCFFDDDIRNTQFGITFEGIPNDATSAVLIFRGRALSNAADNDQIYLGFDDGTQTWDYVNLIPNFLNAGYWTTNAEHEFQLDLGNLPASNQGVTDILPRLRADGYLDIRFQDDTSIDYIGLRVESPGQWDLLLRPQPFVAPGNTRITVWEVPAGQTVWLVHGPEGPGDGPCPPVLNGACLGIWNPLGAEVRAVADATGVAHVVVNLPGSVNAEWLTMQAVVVTPSGQVMLSNTWTGGVIRL